MIRELSQKKEVAKSRKDDYETLKEKGYVPNAASSSSKQATERPKSGKDRSSLSPERKKVTIEEDDPIFASAKGKLDEAAFKFNKERNGIWLKTIENRELDKELFRTSLRSAMNCKLTPSEMDALMPYFDNDGFVNGCEFILLFYQIRFQYRSKLLTDRIQIEKAHRLKDKEYIEKRRAEIEGRNVIKISFDYSEKDKESAMEKAVDAAKKFDKNGPGAPNLDGFDCEYLTPELFKENMRRTFNIKFSPAELGAFIHAVSDDPEGKVHCASFLIYFLRLGLDERTRLLKENWAKKDSINEAAAALEAQRLAEQEAKNNQKVAKFSDEDKVNALMKLRLAAKAYDKNTGMSMKSFEVASMPPYIFREQLKRVFNLKVTAPEMGAIISIFDEQNTGQVACQEFAMTFLAMGFAERGERDKLNLEKQRLADQARVQEDEAKLIALSGKNNIAVPQDFSEDDHNSAMYKLKKSARKFEKSAPGAPNLEAFTMKSMPPFIFKEQLRRAFNIKLTQDELGAIMSQFDPNRTGEVDCNNFLQRFLKIGFEEREIIAKRWRVMQKEADELAIREAKKKIDKDSKKVLLKVAAYEQSHLDSGFDKLTYAAINYRKSPSDVLDAFEAKGMPPHVFKEQLKLVFNVRVSMEELGALMAYYDPEGTGTVNCKDFMNKFLKIGFEERAKIEESWRMEDISKKEKNKKYWEDKEIEKELKQLSEVDFEYVEGDVNTAIMKFIKMCHAFEQRQLGPAGWAGFSAASFSPAEFREMMKRTFEVKLTSKELGVLVTNFQKESVSDPLKRRAGTQYFLQCFVQGRTRCEEFKGKPDEKKRLQEYHQQLKEEYTNRLDRLGGNVDATRPWRSTVTMKKDNTGAMVMTTSKPYPENPTEKINRRMANGKSTGRLDLATKVRWPEGDENQGFVQVGEKKTGGKKTVKKSVKGGANLSQRSANVEHDANALALAAFQDDDMFKLRADFRLLNVPPEVFKMTSLEELWLCNNKLGMIPSQIGDLKKLKVLGLTNNDLNTIPPEICNLPLLKTLILRINNLVELPDAFVNLQYLIELDCGKNQFREIPEVLTRLERLQILKMNNNKITTVPPAFRQLKSISFLSLDHNPIKNIPKVFEHMYWLDVSGCTLPVTDRASYRFKVLPEEEEELEGLIRSKAAARQERDKLRKRRAPL